MFDYGALNDMFVRLHGFGVRGVAPASVLHAVRRATPHGDLWNVSVRTPDRRTPDDVTYQQHPELRELVPRGLVVVHVPGSSSQLQPLLSLFPKFEGLNPIDEDDVSTDTKEGTAAGLNMDVLAPPNTAEAEALQYWVVRKINGHTFFAHAIHDVLYAGTKNCAWAATEAEARAALSLGAEDNDFFPSSMVADVYRAILQLIDDHAPGVVMDACRKQVVVGEVETNQHLVFYPHPTLRVFDASLPDVFPKPFRLGPFTLLDLKDLSFQCRLRSGVGEEGWVVEAHNGAGRVVGRGKVKTVWYVLARALRELWKTGMSAAEAQRRFYITALARNTFLLAPLSRLEAIVDAFFRPLIEYLVATGVTKEHIAHNGVGFACVLKEFTHRHCALDLDALFTLDAMCPPDLAMFHWRDALANPVPSVPAPVHSQTCCRLVMTVCLPPGAGKTSWMKGVVDALRGLGYRAEAISQDEFAGVSRVFHKTLRSKLQDLQRYAETHGQDTFLCLHRGNWDSTQRDTIHAAAAAAGVPREHCVYVSYTDDLSCSRMLYACLKGVLSADREGHGTLSPSKTALSRLFLVPASFWAHGCHAPDWGDVYDCGIGVVRVPLLRDDIDPDAGLLEAVTAFGAAVTGAAQWSLEDFPTVLGHDGTPVAAEALAAAIKEGAEIRRPLDVVIDEVLKRIMEWKAGASTSTSTTNTNAGAGAGAGASTSITSASAVAGVGASAGASAGVGVGAGASTSTSTSTTSTNTSASTSTTGVGVDTSLGTSTSTGASAVAYVSIDVPTSHGLWDLARESGLGDFSAPDFLRSGDHVTVHYQPTREDVCTRYIHLLGKPFQVHITEVVALADGSLCAARVVVPEHPNRTCDHDHDHDHHHITLAWRRKSRHPVDSNAMLAGTLGITHTVPVPCAITLPGKLSFHYAKRK